MVQKQVYFLSVMGLLFIVAFSISAADVNLIDYPMIFTEQYNDNLVFVIGDFADVADAIGSVDVATSLQAAAGSKDLVGSAKLASEIESPESYNIISIGGPCANSLTSKLMGYPANCNEGFVPGRGIIKLFSNGNDRIALVIAGATAIDTQRACRVLARHELYDLAGKEMIVEGTNLQDIVLMPK